ncbi:MAG TPA: carboxypeptidase-like regulatory domain-containing protein [Candidatus Thermoplasmatota archaeon]|nr:carboxypeptidase-like regulatory domain-containing protein [Candidatus Thermoplasmatota archaeon]
MRSLLLAATLVAATASGCVGGDAGPAAASLSDAPILDDRVSRTQGAILGTITDASRLPVGNATVILFAGGAKGEELARATTLVDGAFAFPLLDPTTYRLHAEAQGFGTASILVTVTPEEVSDVRLMLADAPSKVPYVVLLTKIGRLSCAGAYVLTPTGGNCPNEPSTWNIVFVVPEGYHRIMSEAAWQGSDQLAQYFYVDNESTNSGVTTLTLAEAWGKSPIRMTFNPGEKKQTMSSNPVFAGTFTALPNGTKFSLNISTYYAGLYADEINSTGGAACKYVYGRCAGVGFTLDLRWTQYISVFVNGLPDGIETYSAIPKP